MKKIFLIFSVLLLSFSFGMALKGGVVEEVIPKGFFGSWGVISKLKNTNNVKFFNYESRDVWTLGGYSNILILQNLQSGAYSEIIIKETPKDGKTLTFERKKEVKNQNEKIVYKEKITFTLLGDKFDGTDDFTFEKYDLGNKLIEKNYANYVITGVRISNSK